MIKSPNVPRRTRVLRIAHMTDVHVQPEGDAPAGLARALQHVQRLADKPDVIFNGGDAIMDSLQSDKSRALAQWQTWRDVLSSECSLPIVHCIGNHDVWGWESSHSPSGQDRLYGKQWAMDEFGLQARYYGFDRAGWRFIVLDSTYPVEGGYTARLDDEQFEWLKEQLERTPKATPVCVLSHIPIVCFCAFFDGENEASGNWQVPGAWMHLDARRIKNLFHEHPNVKLCLSGHMHLVDEVKYLGVKYLCNGAVCGDWWRGAYHEFPPGYALVDLYDDGSSESEFVTYPWK